MMLRTRVVREINLFDPSFFAHMEEIDFCWRALNRGYTIWCQPASLVYHVGGGTLPQGNPRKTFLNVRNSLAMLHKNVPQGKVIPQILARLLLDGVWGAKLLLGGDVRSVKAILQAHWAYLGRWRYWQQRRRDLAGAPPQGWPSQGIWPGSVVWAYFARGKKHWSSLSWPAQSLRDGVR